MEGLLHGDGILLKILGGFIGKEYCVYPMKNVVEHLHPLLGAALSGEYKIFQVDIYLGQGVHLLLWGCVRPLIDVCWLGGEICRCQSGHG